MECMCDGGWENNLSKQCQYLIIGVHCLESQCNNNIMLVYICVYACKCIYIYIYIYTRI